MTEFFVCFSNTNLIPIKWKIFQPKILLKFAYLKKEKQKKLGTETHPKWYSQSRKILSNESNLNNFL